MNQAKNSRVRTIRLLRGWNQCDLAIRSGIGRADVCRLERGYHVSERVRHAIANALGMSVEALQDPAEKK